MSNVFNKKQTGLLLVALLCTLLLLVPETTHAASSWIPNWLTNAATGAVSYAFSGLMYLLGPLFYAIATLIGGAVLYLGSLVLDHSVYYLVVRMGSFFAGNAEFGQAVTLGWTLIRDLINMTFIFGLIYIGIKTILNSEDSGTRKQLGLLIAAALLINFSLFFTQLLVDFSNLLATQMYRQLAPQSQTTGVPSFTASFMGASGLSGFMTTGSIQQQNTQKPAITGGNLVVYSMMLFIFYVLAGISFLMGAIMIITRFIALTLYMTFSPVMFLGWILPQFQSYASDWWQGFWKYCIFAPIYLFLLYISLQVLSGLTRGTSVLATASGSRSLEVLGQATQQAQTSTGQIIISFMIMIGLLWASMKIGDKLSISGSKMAMNVTGAAQSALGAPLRATGAWGYRNTVGRAASGLVNKYDDWDAKAASEKGTSGRRRAVLKRFIVGGESGRQALEATGKYGAGGRGREDQEKRVKTREGRIRATNRSNKLEEGLKDETNPTMAELSSREVTDYAKDSEKRSLLMKAAGSATPSQIKALEGDKEVHESIVKEFKDKHKAAVKDKVKSAKDLTETINKQFKKDAKEVSGLFDNIAKDKDGNIEPEKIDMIAEAIENDPNLARSIGQHLDPKIAEQLKPKLEERGLGDSVSSRWWATKTTKSS